MHLAYLDESGNPGVNGSRSYTVACVIVEDRRWLGALDQLVAFRRFLKERFGLPVRAEVKANYLLQNKGAFRELELSEGARFGIYRGFMRLQAKLELKCFAVVIDKQKQQATADPRRIAWDTTFQRLERFSTKTDTPLLVIHDEGDAGLIRRLTRESRRRGIAGSAYGFARLDRPAKLLVEDPVPRRSDQSYFIQLADLNAYAAFRAVFPPPERKVQIVPEALWNELGSAIYRPVNQRGGVPGIVQR